MANPSNFNLLLKKLDSLSDLPEKYKRALQLFFQTYTDTLKQHNISIEPHLTLFETLIELLQIQAKQPFHFEPYHQKLLTPFNYYQFGLEFVRPLIDSENSTISGREEIDKISAYLARKENVILLSNHQIEADPQVIALMLEKTDPEIAHNMIFVAGERVITDPLAIPFSLGLNLLCIYSKRYIDHPPELKLAKQLHNKRTMEKMSQLLQEGGKCIWVAPSGGRDRLDEAGKIEIAPFDPQSIEMFYLMTKKSKRPTHFIPLTLATYSLLPPPEKIQVELGEERLVMRSSVHIHFDKEIDMEHFPDGEKKDKHTKRKLRAEHIHDIVQRGYSNFRL